MIPTNDAPVTVEQCDREAAYLYWLFTRSLDETDYRAKLMQTEFEKGARDEQETVQAFARHRLAALASAPAGDHVPDAGNMIAPAGDGVEAAAILRRHVVVETAPIDDATVSAIIAAMQEYAALARPRAAVGEVPCWSRRMTEEEARELVGFEPDTILTCLREWGYVEDAALQSPPAKVEE